MFELGLKNKVAIITGGSDGLGFASAKLLSELGSKVVICGRRGKYLKDKARSISTITGKEVLDIQADVSDQNDCKELVEKTVKEFKKIDILLNNAGTSAALEFEKVTDDQWEEDIVRPLHFRQRNGIGCRYRQSKSGLHFCDPWTPRPCTRCGSHCKKQSRGTFSLQF